MRRVALLLLAAISATWAAGETRPHYGGTLRVAMQSSPGTLSMRDAADPAAYWDMARVLALVGDTLVRVDAEDRPQPALAVEWQRDASARHWQFLLRPVKFHDGSWASPAAIAQILAALHPNWTVRTATMGGGVRAAGAGTSSGDSITIDTDVASPSLPAELAMPRNLILKRDASGIPVGTGPFRVTDFQPGKSLKLAASDESWAGRPYIDGVEMEFGKSLREQGLALELGRVDLAEAAPDAGNGSDRVRTSMSLPVELMALVFTPNSRVRDARVREALALSINRKPIQFVLLKGAGEPTASLLPNWMTGYSAAFSTQPNAARAKALLAEAGPPALTLSYDPRDPQAQLIAERIALNAGEVGIGVQVSLSGPVDVRLMRIVLPLPDPALALREAARELSLGEPTVRGDSVEELYAAERALLESHTVIPLFHVPVASGAGPRVRGWSAGRLGLWNIADVWLEDAR